MNYINYETFLIYLKSLNNTERVLYAVFEYFRDYVSYNYDELQVAKLTNLEGNLLSIINYAESRPASLETKDELLKMLDDEFLKLEGRKLTESNRQHFFKNYGKKVHFKEIPEQTKTLFGKTAIIKGKPARDEIVNKINVEIQYDSEGYTHLVNSSYPPKFYSTNGESTEMLQDAVCSTYSMWMKKICDDLGITCYCIKGRGSTGHMWNIIYLPEKNEWVNFDMTMVRFYLDKWIDSKGYTPEDWIFASNKKMFEMQPSRMILSIETIPPTIINNNNIQQFEAELEKLKPSNQPKIYK